MKYLELDWRKLLVSVVGVSWSIFQLLVTRWILLDPIVLRSLHMSFGLTLVFLLALPNNRRLAPTISNLAFAFLSCVGGIYIALNFERLIWHTRGIDPFTPLDILMGSVTIVMALIAGKRSIGTSLVVITGIFLIYMLVGSYMPGMLYHRGMSIIEVIETQYFTTSGLFGLPMDISATYIYLFMLFAAFMYRCGAGTFFTDLAFGVLGQSRGGPAKAAVVSSALFGTVSGSGAANVATTGMFTIPLMKKVGYKPHVAGAVEAVSSTGGQLMPPVMGAAVFIMADLLGMPYITIAISATIPAILYYVALYFAIDFEAAKQGLKGLPREDIPPIKQTLKDYMHLLIPLGVLVYFLLNLYTPILSCLSAIFTTVIVANLRKKTRMGPRNILKAMEEGAVSATLIVATCALSGLILGSFLYTGLSINFTALLTMIGGGQVLPTLILLAIAALILGMGMGTTAVYITVAALMVPVLIKIGIAPLAAHLFAFYFGMLSLITPPVAVAAFVGAGIAKADPLKTAVTATRLGIVAFIIPFMFIFWPAMLGQGSPLEILLTFATASVGCYCMAAGVIGYLMRGISLLERGILILAALFLIWPERISDIVGLLIFVVMVIKQRAMSRRVLPMASP